MEVLRSQDVEFASKPRYLYEIAGYLQISKKTLLVWIQDIEGVTYNKKKRIYSAREVKLILENYF